jgi:protoporphyrinogen/coproporphyrinogen III oxidase
LLNLQSSLITVKSTSAAARTRFLHIPGTNGLTALPSSAFGALASPLGRKLSRAVAFEPFKSFSHDLDINDVEDEPFEQFLAARIGPELARILGSALVHGIYAADSRQLSVKAAFPSLWNAAKRGNGSLVRGMLKPSSKAASVAHDDHDLGNIQKSMEGVSVYSFRDGMATLTGSLEKYLLQSPNVELVKNDGVTVFNKSSSDGIIFVSEILYIYSRKLLSSLFGTGTQRLR